MDDRHPMYSSESLRTIETRAAAALGDGFILMKRAGLAAWHCVLAHWPQARRIVVACGPGNNGGDGYVLARHALESGREVRVLRLAAHAPATGLAQRAEADYLGAGGPLDCVEFDDHDADQIAAGSSAFVNTDLIVDALFGIGLSRAPAGDVATLIAAITASAIPVLALDVPSGVDADAGNAPGVAIAAERTLQFITAHPGLRTGPALEFAGQCDVARLDIDIGQWSDVRPAAYILATDDLRGFLPLRPRNSHKGLSGRVLCIGGDHGKEGAIILCAEAALRSGAGLVDVATRTSALTPLLARRPEAMVHPVDEAASLAAHIGACDAIAIGPGLGQAAWGASLFDAIRECGKPCVFDADALNLLAASDRNVSATAILTPHPGEAARLLGMSTHDVQRDRFAAVAALCDRYGCTIVLKGAGTLVAAPGRTPRVINAGNPGMAVGGMGDVLTGIIAAMLAQGLPTFEAACCGALLHSSAADRVASAVGERGMLPSDLFHHLQTLANP